MISKHNKLNKLKYLETVQTPTINFKRETENLNLSSSFKITKVNQRNDIFNIPKRLKEGILRNKSLWMKINNHSNRDIEKEELKELNVDLIQHRLNYDKKKTYQNSFNNEGSLKANKIWGYFGEKFEDNEEKGKFYNWIICVIIYRI